MFASLARWIRLPSPTESTRHWHIAPAIDVVAYHLSWLPMLLILLLVGDRHPTDYAGILAFVLMLNYTHQLLSLPCVYLDRDVLARDARRFTYFPLAMLAGAITYIVYYGSTLPPDTFTHSELAVLPALGALLLHLDALDLQGRAPGRRALRAALAAALVGAALASPLGLGAASVGLVACAAAALAGSSAPRPSDPPETLSLRARWTPRLVPPLLVGLALVGLAPDWRVGAWPVEPTNFSQVIAPVVAFAAVWNIWHVYMQKYGILRMYNAKSSAPPEHRVPGWVDRLLVFSWIPFAAIYLAPLYRAELLDYYWSIHFVLVPLIDGLERWKLLLWIPSLGLVATSLGLFLYWELRANRLRNVPRLSAGLAMTALSASIVLVNPIKAVIAFGFGHFIEYFVFVWAFQRRLYATHPGPLPWIGRAFQHPTRTILAFVAVFGGSWLWLMGHLSGGRDVALGGVAGIRLLVGFGLFLAMTHFYFDGFLWKMRRPDVRRNIG